MSERSYEEISAALERAHWSPLRRWLWKRTRRRHRHAWQLQYRETRCGPYPVMPPDVVSLRCTVCGWSTLELIPRGMTDEDLRLALRR